MVTISYNELLHNISNIEEAYIKKVKSGFIVNDVCNIIKDTYSYMCLHFIQNKDIFTDEQINSVNNIIHLLNNG